MSMPYLNEEEQQRVQKLDVVSLAAFVFRYLKNNHDSEPDDPDFYYSVDHLWNTLFPGERGNRSCSDYTHLLEAIALLETRGLVAKDICSYPHVISASHKYHIFLTSIGIKSNFHDGALLLVDKPEEIIREVEQKVGDLDDVVRQYYLESLRAYQEGLYISSVICLGAASERAILWLAESIESFCSKYQQPIQKRRRNISDLTKYLSGSILSDIFPNDATFETELRKRLVLLGDLYRENRNEAGHPKTVDQSWLGEDQEILLIHFRRYITTICKAVERLKKQSAS